MKKTVLKWIVLLLLLAYGVWAAVWAGRQAAGGNLEGIEIEVLGDARNDSTIRNGLVDCLMKYDNKLIGRPLAQIDTRKLEKYLDGYSNFEEVECALTTQRKLRVAVTPMIPEIRVFDNGKSYYINKAGKHIRADAGFYTDVPVVTGSFNKDMPATGALPVARFITADPLLSNLIAMVHYRDPDNIILIPRLRGAVINLGDTTRLPEKQQAIAAAYKKILPRRGWETYDTVSVKFRGQIVCTRREKALADPYAADDAEDLEEATLIGLADQTATEQE